jgi:hypothetical protein
MLDIDFLQWLMNTLPNSFPELFRCQRGSGFAVGRVDSAGKAFRFAFRLKATAASAGTTIF